MIVIIYDNRKGVVTLKKFIAIIIVSLMFLSGCFCKRKVELERMCTRVDLKSIEELFPTSVDGILSLAQRSKDIINSAIESIAKVVPKSRNYKNTVLAYEQAYFQFYVNLQVLSVLSMASQDSAIQAASNRAVIDLQQYQLATLSRNESLYKAFKQYQMFGCDAYKKTLSVQYFVKDSIKKFEQSGIALPIERQEKIAQIERDIQGLEAMYYGNTLNDFKDLELSKDELKGLSDQFVARLQKSKNKFDHYLLPSNLGTFYTVMENCLVESTRKAYYLMFGQQAYPANESILKLLVDKRYENATLLDYPNFAAYQLDGLMVATPNKAEAFLWEMVKDLQPYDDKDFESITQILPPSVNLEAEGKLKPWDEALVKSWYRKKHFDVNDYQVSEYFDVLKVIPALLQKFSQFFNISFEPVYKPACQVISEKSEKLWAKELMTYRVRSTKHQGVLGYIVLDLYSRPFKNIASECHLMVVPAIRDDCSSSCIGMSAVFANLKKPTHETPTLLEFNDVITIFHEMGHALHGLFGATRFTKYSGTNVVSDFVEVPSQMLERWFEDPGVLKFISCHYKTGEPLSDKQILNIIAARKFGRSSRMLKQLFFSLVSLKLFTHGHTEDIHKMIEDLYKRVFRHVAYDKDWFIEMSFAHIVQKYYAAYYGYPWSEVIAADLYNHIKNAGNFDRDTGSSYVTEILSHGGAKNPNEMLKKFLGRPWNTKSYFEFL